MSFKKALAELGQLEGGYSDDPKDPGNWTGGEVGSGELRGTMCGISAAAYPKLDIVNLKPPQIEDIYRQDFWDKMRCDTLPDAVAVALFKEGVNMGVSGGVKALQRSLKTDDDGDIGSITIGLATSQAPKLVVTNFLTECAFEYTQMKKFSDYGRGWLSRVIKTAIEVSL